MTSYFLNYFPAPCKKGLCEKICHSSPKRQLFPESEYVTNETERNAKWDLVRKDYMPAIDEMCEIIKRERCMNLTIISDRITKLFSLLKLEK